MIKNGSNELRALCSYNLPPGCWWEAKDSQGVYKKSRSNETRMKKIQHTMYLKPQFRKIFLTKERGKHRFLSGLCWGHLGEGKMGLVVIIFHCMCGYASAKCSKFFKNAKIYNSFKDQMYMLKFLVELDQSG